MSETELDELKTRLARAEMINDQTCSMLETALNVIKHLNTELAEARDQYENLLRLQAEQNKENAATNHSFVVNGRQLPTHF